MIDEEEGEDEDEDKDKEDVKSKIINSVNVIDVIVAIIYVCFNLCVNGSHL